MKKFKVGQRYVVGSATMAEAGNAIEITKVEGKNVFYRTVKQVSKNYGGSCVFNRGSRFSCVLIPIKNECIVIYRKGREVIALDKLPDKKDIAKCCPDDEFDFKVGAKLAFERLMDNGSDSDCRSLYNGKVVCIDACENPTVWTRGKIYQFKNGFITHDRGDVFPAENQPVHSFEEWESWTRAKFVEVIE